MNDFKRTTLQDIKAHTVKCKQIEDQLLRIIQSRISDIEFTFWFEIFFVLDVNYDQYHILILVESSVHADWISTYYSDLIFDSLKIITGEEYSMQIDVYDEDIDY